MGDDKSKDVRRRRLPDERESITRKIEIADFDGYVTVGLYPEDKAPGEVFIKFSKEGSTLSGLVDAFAVMFSLALQYGVPLKVICEKLAYTRYDPAGYTRNKEIPYASSITDYIARWMAHRFLGNEPPVPDKPWITLSPPPPGKQAPPLVAPEIPGVPDVPKQEPLKPLGIGSPCQICGTLMQATGRCETCPSCGWNSGCG